MTLSYHTKFEPSNYEIEWVLGIFVFKKKNLKGVYEMKEHILFAYSLYLVL